MPETTKDTLQGLADQEAFRAAFERAREVFGQIEGVVGFGIGLKEKNGQFGNDLAIVVLVREKKPEANLPDEQRIPPVFQGYNTDVRVAPNLTPGACDNETKYERIQGGIQICTKGVPLPGNLIGVEKGTLCCIVRKRQNAGRENVCVLSNKHVLQTRTSGVDDYIYHPNPPEVGGDYTTLGPVQSGGVYDNIDFVVTQGSPPERFFVDCAIARLDIDSKCFGSTCTKDTTEYDTTIIDLQLNGVNTLKDVRNVIGAVSFVGATVFKVGRTTGRTQGRVVSVNLDFPCQGDPAIAGSPTFTARNGLEIAFAPTAAEPQNCKGHTWFAEKGDSGSIVVDDQNRVVAIISQVPDPATAPPSTTAVACHIVPILDLLRICVPCTQGTSHGSSLATDGSGILPAGSPTGDFPLPDGQIAFSGDGVGGEQSGARSLPEPELSTASARDRMLTLRDQLRQTSEGRALHDTFAEVRREIGYLIRNVRSVKLAWHRLRGPAFLACLLKQVRGEARTIPREIDGVSRAALLARMDTVLSEHGSNPLREAIESHREMLMLLANVDSAEEFIGILGRAPAEIAA